MHQPARDGLEEFLTGEPRRGGLRDFEAHLGACGECRETVRAMQEQARLFEVLRPPEGIEPGPGFYSRVLARIDAQRVPSLWALFLQPAFGRRFVAVAALLVVLLGGYLAALESQAVESPALPEVMIAVEPHSQEMGLDPQRDRAATLVTLSTYQE